MTDKISQLERLAQLRASGTLPEAEFEKMKAQVLNAPADHTIRVEPRSVNTPPSQSNVEHLAGATLNVAGAAGSFVKSALKVMLVLIFVCFLIAVVLTLFLQGHI